MLKEYNQVKEFHKAFNHPVGVRPEFMGKERVGKRYAWMLEEIDEFKEAVTLEEQADAMIDLMYFALGTMVELGVEPDKLFDIVQQANMSKLWEDGRPHYKEDGKVKKPSTWVDPDPLIHAEIERQKQKQID